MHRLRLDHGQTILEEKRNLERRLKEILKEKSERYFKTETF